jgi:RNA polymerase sigma-70 factor, ECF subfamily
LEIQELIKHCKKGNPVAQGTLFNSFYSPMFNLSMRFLANYHDVEDVLIIAFLKVFESIRSFEYRGENSLNKWIKTIVINESIRFCKTKNHLTFDDNISVSEKNFSDEYQIEIIDVELVYAIIENMPAGYRLVFNLFAIEGYSHKEISELLNISENTSKSQLRKARLNIIEKLNTNQNYGN